MSGEAGKFVVRLRILLQKLRRTPFFQKILPIIDFASLKNQETMLADKIRMSNYHRGISKHVKEGDVVVDLGAGTGILSFFAAQSGASKVYAIEQENIIEKAKRLAELNGFTSVSFVKSNSRQFSLDSRVDVIVHEQMGFNLFEENMVPNVIDLRDRVLKPGGKILPGRFELFIEPIMIQEAFAAPFVWELNIYGVDYSGMKEFESEYKPGDRTVNIRPSDVEKFLCEPEPVYAIDLHTMKAEELHRKLSYTREIKNGGRLSGFMIYFNSYFDEELGFSTWAPESKTHWGLTVLRVEGRDCAPGQKISFEMNVGDWANAETWDWNYRVSG